MNTFSRLLPTLFKDPPPKYAFELSEAGISFTTFDSARQIQFAPLEAGVINAALDALEGATTSIRTVIVPTAVPART